MGRSRFADADGKKWRDMASLKIIQIEGYRSIQHAELELRALNVLIGPNGAGKSNVFPGYIRWRWVGRIIMLSKTAKNVSRCCGR